MQALPPLARSRVVRSIAGRVAVTALALSASWAAAAATGIQVGPSGKTFASSAISCAMNPVSGMAPMVTAGLYNPAKHASATVSVNGATVASVTFASPSATLWLPDGADTVTVALSRRVADSYAFDAATTFPGQPNICIPDTRNNSVVVDLEYAASGKSYATVTPGCALNAATGRAQPYVNLFDNGGYLLNVSINNTPLTQLSSTRPHTPVFLSAGLNVISAANAALSTDHYVRDGGSGSCTLP
ncbi:hypothetical protein [Aquabacterium sp.]|uniref:hypothetical protein n=1 Tax=Aquabacterium sp. TaxID=1872578 RepID=UPI00378480D0